MDGDATEMLPFKAMHHEQALSNAHSASLARIAPGPAAWRDAILLQSEPVMFAENQDAARTARRRPQGTRQSYAIAIVILAGMSGPGVVWGPDVVGEALLYQDSRPDRGMGPDATPDTGPRESERGSRVRATSRPVRHSSMQYLRVIAGAIFLLFAFWSLRTGKTIGLYGIVETRSSPFYWIIVTALMLIGFSNLWVGLREFWLKK